MQGDWKAAPNQEADELLALVHGAALPLEGVCLHGSENELPLPSRKALAELRNTPGSAPQDSASLAGAPCYCAQTNTALVACGYRGQRTKYGLYRNVTSKVV